MLTSLSFTSMRSGKRELKFATVSLSHTPNGGDIHEEANQVSGDREALETKRKLFLGRQTVFFALPSLPRKKRQAKARDA